MPRHTPVPGCPQPKRSPSLRRGSASAPAPVIDAGRYARQALRRRRRRRRRRHLPRRPREAPRRRPLPRAGRPQLARGRDARRSTPTSTASAGRASSRSRPGPLGVRRSRPGSTSSPPGATSSQRKVAAGAGGPLRRAVRGRRAARGAPRRAKGARTRARSSTRCAVLRDDGAPTQRVRRRARARAVRRPMERTAGAPRRRRGWSKALPLEVDRVRARFGVLVRALPALLGRAEGASRSTSRRSPSSASTCSTCRRSTRSACKNRKGRNNTLVAGPDDPGSPYAIGGTEGGHDAVHPELGTVEDVARAVRHRARARHGRRAWTSRSTRRADHPWLTEHPEWFHRRPDGTLKYAENPPKKYQDIYNVNWEHEDWRGAVGGVAADLPASGSTPA